MDSRVNYTVVGFFIIVLGVAMIAATIWLSSAGHYRQYHRYLVYMDEAVSGLSEQAPVKFNGVQVGYVESVKLNPKDPQQVRLVLSIETHVPITTATVASLVSQGITGITHIGLKAVSATGNPLVAKAGETYPVIQSQPSLLVELDKTIRDISTRFREISQRISEVIDADNVKALKTTLANLDQITTTFVNNNKQIDNTLKNADYLMENLSQSSELLPETMRRIESAMQQVDRASRSFGDTMNDAQVAIETISHQALPTTVETLQRFEQIAGHLEQLSQDLADNPSILVRGKVMAQPGPGE